MATNKALIKSQSKKNRPTAAKKTTAKKTATKKAAVKKTAALKSKTEPKPKRKAATTAAVTQVDTPPVTIKKGLANKKYDLVIVESPAKAQTIKKYLGKGHEVIASNGHIKDLPKSKLGVDVDKKFAVEMAMISGKKTVVDKLRKYIAAAKTIYLAPDPDREGEAIAFHIAEIAEEIGEGDRVKRVLFNAITRNAVQEAMNNPLKLNKLKYESQKARRVLDRLVGYKISPLLWDKIQRGLSAGRVQSVALRLIVEREDEIKVFVSEQWFSITADLLAPAQQQPFKAGYYGESATKKTELLDKNFVDIILAEIKGQKFKVLDVKAKEKKQNPTPPFTTSKLQQEAANKLFFAAKKTMIVAQKLYEGVELSGYGPTGLITYMRTDSVRTDPSAITEVRNYISNKYGEKFLPNEPIIYKKKGGGKVQDAHEAIRPSSLEFPPEKVRGDLEEDAYKLYELIWNKFVSSQMAPAIIDQTTVLLEVNKHFFKAVGSVIKFPGYRTIYLESILEKRARRGGGNANSVTGTDGSVAENDNVDNADNADNHDSCDINDFESFDRPLPVLTVGEELTPVKDPEAKEHWTSPPPRYNDASIVKDLEEKGIGRPSTYATIISNIVDRGYVEKREGRYWPTELGSIVCKMLIESFPTVMSVEFTANVEALLDKIEEGEAKWTNVLGDFWSSFEKTLKLAKEHMKNLKKTQIPTGLRCNRCGEGEYLVKWGKNGRFLACSRYPECASTEDFVNHIDGSYEIIPKKLTNKSCPKCQKRMIVRKGRYGQFLSCEDFPQCKTTLPFTLDIYCPECKTNEIAERNTRYGKVFYGCSGYPNCTFAMWGYPTAMECPNCSFPILGKRESKRAGVYYQCPKCKKTTKGNG
ncbi:MAG: type I DNA topoisomerase [Oligoflexia bacterium]|nr:type I DNA topoisomerase [Oligoflexia bacterium]